MATRRGQEDSEKDVHDVLRAGARRGGYQQAHSTDNILPGLNLGARHGGGTALPPLPCVVAQKYVDVYLLL